MILHAGLVAAYLPGGWRGALIEGPSGVGKSDLALRALQMGLRLVADDRVITWTSGGTLYGRAPDNLAGLMEIAGLDVVGQPALARCRISVWVRCGTPERLPDPQAIDHLGLQIPLITLAPLEASAPAKLFRALQRLGRNA